MRARSSSCAECGAAIALTSGAAVIRGGVVLLYCAACRPPEPALPARSPTKPVDLEDDATDDDAYDVIVVSRPDGGDRGLESASGAVESDGPGADPDARGEPAVIVSPEA